MDPIHFLIVLILVALKTKFWALRLLYNKIYIFPYIEIDIID